MPLTKSLFANRNFLQTQNKLIMLVSINTPVSEIMTKNVVKVHQMTTMDKVKAIFDNQVFHHIPIIDKDDKLIGIIRNENLTMLCHNMTIFNRVREEKFNEIFLTTVYAQEAMTKYVVTLRPNDSVGFAAGIFRENLFHALPIVDENNEVVGILTTYDLLKYAYF